MDRKIKVRLRLVIIKEGKILLTWFPKEDFYYYLGGKLEFGETIESAAQREVYEECGENVNFSFDKILYVRDFIQEENNEHSVELYILGDIDKFEELEDRDDPEHPGERFCIWKPIDSLPENLLPKTLSAKIAIDYKAGFPSQGEYLGPIT